MAKCTRCGGFSPWIGVCPKCQEADKLKQQSRYAEEEAKKKAQMNRQTVPTYSPTIKAKPLNGYQRKKWYRNGDLYRGYMKDNCRHGKGIFTRDKDKYTYDGDWYMDKRHGSGTEQMPGKWTFTGTFTNGMRNGYGKLVFADGASYEGEFADNERCGNGIEICANGVVYSGQWQKGRMNGRGKMTFPNGSSYEGDFVDGRYNGKGIYFNHEKNETYEGTFKDGKINGFAVQRRADGSVYEGFFENNSKVGKGRDISPDGSVTEGHWEDDKFIVDNTESGHSGAAPQQETVPSSESKHPVQQQRRRPSADEQNAQSGANAAGQDNADFLTDTGYPVNESSAADKNCPADESYAADEVYADNAGGSVAQADDGEVECDISPEDLAAFMAGGSFGENNAQPSQNSGEVPVEYSNDDEAECDISPDDLAAFMANGTIGENVAGQGAHKTVRTAPVMPDFKERCIYFDRTLFAIDKNGTLRISGKLLKKNADIAKLNGHSGIKCLASCTHYNIIILDSDGNVVYVDSSWKSGILGNKEIKAILPKVREWSGLCKVACGTWNFAGLRSDGTVIGEGRKTCSIDNVYKWTDITDIACASLGTVGLKSDGTVVSCGFSREVEDELKNWSGIVSIACGDEHIVGLKKDGTLVACGKNNLGQCDVSSFKNVVMITAGGDTTALLTADSDDMTVIGKTVEKGYYDKGVIAASYASLGNILTLDKTGVAHCLSYGMDLPAEGVDLSVFTRNFEW